ncbi:hypothetical protein TrVE_jg11450 [Triparma verrucosa]|uniref:Uncharacterized protein n=3 Tax=Triparma verrucosa TaxID=1606542 RepID=A0A9W7CAC6_9STRA|nr:hypothetical protein TrVE_jg11450 [Triparma verrucosa]
MTSCTPCPQGLTNDDGLCAVLSCKTDEFNNAGKCEKCNNTVSIFIIVGSILSFTLVTFYVDKLASGTSKGRQKMIRLKVLATFFQTSELTTMVKISWPTIIFWVMPFRLPMSDAGCLASDMNDEGQMTVAAFFIFTLVPLVLMYLAIHFARKSRNPAVKQSVSNTVIFLATIWYTPVLQMVGKMYDCYEDPERPGSTYLLADPKLKCYDIDSASGETSMSTQRHFIHFVAISIAFLIGIGFPYFIVSSTRMLQRSSKLNMESSLASLYQYSPSMPYFEAIQMLRKAALIFTLSMSGVLGLSPLAQSLFCFSINFIFFIVLYFTEPLIYYPCSLFKNRNLNNLSELLGAGVTLAGSILALVGALSKNNQGTVNILGIIFVIINVTFASTFFYAYHVDVKRTAEVKAALIIESASTNKDGMTTSLTRDDSISLKLAKSVKEGKKILTRLLVSLREQKGNSRLR